MLTPNTICYGVELYAKHILPVYSRISRMSHIGRVKPERIVVKLSGSLFGSGLKAEDLAPFCEFFTKKMQTGVQFILVAGGGELARRFAGLQSPAFHGALIVSERLLQEELLNVTDRFRQSYQAQVGLGISINPGTERQDVYLALLTPDEQQTYYRPYGGPPEYAPRWAAHLSLDLIRKLGKENP